MAVRMITLAGDTPEAWRLALSLFGHPSASAILDRRGGLAPGTGVADLIGTTAMKATVGPFIAWVDGTSGASQGGYIVHNNAALELEFEPGEASVTRIDRVIVQVRDTSYDSSGAQDARVLVLKGNAGGGATDLPASSELLWEVSVPAGASIGDGGFNVSSARTDKRRWTTSNGGMLLVKDSADLATLTPHEGMHVYRLDAADRQVYRGGAWIWDGTPRSVVKPTDETVTNSNAWQNDDHLLATVPSGAYFKVELFAGYAAHSAANMKFGWNTPANATFAWMVTSKAGSLQPNGNSGTPAFDLLDKNSEPRVGGWQGDNTSKMALTAQGTLYSGDGGTLGFRWTQDTAHLTGTKVLASSLLVLTRIG